jgi:pentatricopeptide repeat protein
VRDAGRPPPWPTSPQVLESYPQLGLTPDVDSYNCVVEACAIAGKVGPAETVLSYMASQGLRPTSRTWSLAMRAPLKAGDLPALLTMLTRQGEARVGNADPEVLEAGLRLASERGDRVATNRLASELVQQRRTRLPQQLGLTVDASGSDLPGFREQQGRQREQRDRQREQRRDHREQQRGQLRSRGFDEHSTARGSAGSGASSSLTAAAASGGVDASLFALAAEADAAGTAGEARQRAQGLRERLAAGRAAMAGSSATKGATAAGEEGGSGGGETGVGAAIGSPSSSSADGSAAPEVGSGGAAARLDGDDGGGDLGASGVGGASSSSSADAGYGSGSSSMAHVPGLPGDDIGLDHASRQFRAATAAG